MKKTIILLISVLLYTFFLPNHVAADYTQELDACNKILSKSSSVHEYCTLHIDAISGDRVTGPMVTISNSYIYPESGVARATKFLEEEYKGKLSWMENLSDQRPGLEKYMKVIEETGQDNMKFLIRQNPDLGFHTGGGKIVYTYHSYLFMQQGSCVMVVDGTANRGYKKRQDGRNEDVDGDVGKLKQESIAYMNKVSNDLTKNCKKEIIKTEAPAALALIDKPPKKSDFRKVSRSDFKLVYPVGTSSANLKPATQSANLKERIFIGKVGGEGEVVVERANGDSVSLKDDMTAHDGYTSPELRRVLSKYGTSTVRNVVPDQHIYYREVDCQILLKQAKQDQETLQRLGFIRKTSDFSFWSYDIIHTTQIGNCALFVEGGPVRMLTEQGRVTFKTLGDALISADNADFGVFYDSSSSTSFVDVYNGSVKVSNKSGQAKTISSVYGSGIKQIVVAKDGTMNEKIAIPQSEWEAFLASQQKKDEASGNIWLVAGTIAVLGVGGLIFFLHWKGKLLPLYKTLSQKVSGMNKNSSKTDKDEEKN